MMRAMSTFFHFVLLCCWGSPDVVAQTGRNTLMLLWMLLRTARYYFVDEGLLKRLLWYAYYILMMLIPPIALMTVLSMNRSDDYRTPKYLRLLPVIGSNFVKEYFNTI